VREAGEEILGFRRRKKEHWIQEGTWDKISERKRMKDKIDSKRSERGKDCYRKKYQDMDKELKDMAKRYKKDYIESLAEKAEFFFF